MAEHARFATVVGVEVYFSDPNHRAEQKQRERPA